jgi:hypothetical protein
MLPMLPTSVWAAWYSLLYSTLNHVWVVWLEQLQYSLLYSPFNYAYTCAAYAPYQCWEEWLVQLFSAVFSL